MKGPGARKLRRALKHDPEKLDELEMEAQRRLAGEDAIKEEEAIAQLVERKRQAQLLSSVQPLTQDDFRRIKHLKEKQVRLFHGFFFACAPLPVSMCLCLYVSFYPPPPVSSVSVPASV